MKTEKEKKAKEKAGAGRQESSKKVSKREFEAYKNADRKQDAAMIKKYVADKK